MAVCCVFHQKREDLPNKWGLIQLKPYRSSNLLLQKIFFLKIVPYNNIWILPATNIPKQPLDKIHPKTSQKSEFKTQTLSKLKKLSRMNEGMFKYNPTNFVSMITKGLQFILFFAPRVDL